MERLRIFCDREYSALEAASHVGRYVPLLPLCAGRRVLDVSCGVGYGSWLLAQAGAAQVDGVDVSSKTLSVACATYRASNLTFHVADAGALAAKLGMASYDLVACIETLEHLPDPSSFLVELQAVMAEDCIFYVTCSNNHWYCAEGAGNLYHARKYRFEEFRELTEGVLGEASRWLFGTAALGFATVPLVQDEAEVPSPYAAARPLGAALMCPHSPADSVEPANASYFVGVWNDPQARVSGGAFFPISMNTCAEKENAVGQVHGLNAGAADATAQGIASLCGGSTSPHQAVLTARGEDAGEIATLKQQNLALATSLRELKARHASYPEENERARAAAAAAAAETASWREKGQSLRVQASALRVENDVLGESLARLRGEFERATEALAVAERERDEARSTLEAQSADLKAELAKKADLSGQLEVSRDLVAKRDADLADRESQLRAEAVMRAVLVEQTKRKHDETRSTLEAQLAYLRAELVKQKADLSGQLEVLRDLVTKRDAEAAMRAVLVERAERELAAARPLVAAARRLVLRGRLLAPRSGRSEAVRRGVLAHEAAVAELGAWPPCPENFQARYDLVAASSLFNPDYYLARNPDVAEWGKDPLYHFVAFGGTEGRRPGPDFDAAAYLRANPDVAEAGENPLVHFLLFGAAEGRPLRKGANRA